MPIHFSGNCVCVCGMEGCSWWLSFSLKKKKFKSSFRFMAVFSEMSSCSLISHMYGLLSNTTCQRGLFVTAREPALTRQHPKSTLCYGALLVSCTLCTWRSAYAYSIWEHFHCPNGPCNTFSLPLPSYPSLPSSPTSFLLSSFSPSLLPHRSLKTTLWFSYWFFTVLWTISVVYVGPLHLPFLTFWEW